MKRQFRNEVIRHALEELDPKCFEILYEFWIRNRSVQEIGDRLGKTPEEVEKHHLNCRKTLMELFDQNEKKK